MHCVCCWERGAAAVPFWEIATGADGWGSKGRKGDGRNYIAGRAFDVGGVSFFDSHAFGLLPVARGSKQEVAAAHFEDDVARILSSTKHALVTYNW